ncbi:MAG: hypothetical protein OEX04_11490 [Acidimicrobiia bacterium]|nr:hypothetical protein [Acidimicrobiia bacterium]MDH4308090.1 hypothetical protein [Acidimicrobiia bacterium]MDH5293092.1 hypothetical protein [Acidimicrobiia bacterium]
MTDLELAMLLADAADAITLPAFDSSTLEVSTKGDGTVVTTADLAAETAMRDLLSRHAPDDGVVGEEHGVTGADFRRWYLDPIDGTSSFAAGRSEWATMIAVEDFDTLTAAVVSSPALGRRWFASRGEGAWARSLLGGEEIPLRVSHVDSVSMARVSAWPPAHRIGPTAARSVDAFLEMAGVAAGAVRGRDVKPTRDTGFPNAGILIAAGALDGFLLCGGGPWDVAPLALVVEEAGGRFSDLDGGRRVDTGGALFTNGPIHDTLLAWARED